MKRHVYFIKPIAADGPIKIGMAFNPKRRLSQLNTISPIRLEIICAVEIEDGTEHKVHGHFWDIHSHGEWFFAQEPLLTFIERIQGGAAVSELIRLPRTGRFAHLIEHLGLSDIASAFGVSESHVRTLKARDSIPPEYWPQLLDLSSEHNIPDLDWPTLSQMRRERFKSEPERIAS